MGKTFKAITVEEKKNTVWHLLVTQMLENPHYLTH